jgi:hypothetical protein
VKKDVSSEDSQKEIRGAMDSLKNDLSYFVHLIKADEIKEPIILEYYGMQLSEVDRSLQHIIGLYPNVKAYPPTMQVVGLIREYNLLADKKKNKFGFG